MTIAFDVSAFLLCAFIVIYELRKRTTRSRQNNVYLLLIGNVMLSAVFAVIVLLNTPFHFVFSITQDMRFEREWMEYVRSFNQKELHNPANG